MTPRSGPRVSVKTPVFPETDINWTMSGTGSSFSEPWNDMFGSRMLARARSTVKSRAGRVMAMADRGRQGVGRVERNGRRSRGKQRFDHLPDLRFLGPAVPRDRLLDRERLV